MSIDNAERRLRATYRATADIHFDDRTMLPAGARRRPVARWLLPATAAAVVVVGVGASVALIHGPSSPSFGPAASPHPSSQQSTAGPSSAGQAGTSRPWRLFVHCGAPVIVFDGRPWAPVPPVPTYPGPRPVHGITSYTGYTTGTLTVLSADRLRFTASDTVSPYAVSYAPATAAASSATRICA